MKGLLFGTAVTIPGSLYLSHRYAYYRQLPISLKALGAVMVIVPAVIINAERAGLKFEREHRYVVLGGVE